jgi:hypothetical protein
MCKPSRMDSLATPPQRGVAFRWGDLESQAPARRRADGSQRRDGTDISREPNHQIFVFEAFGGVDR